MTDSIAPAPRASGIYALIQLDGQPCDQRAWQGAGMPPRLAGDMSWAIAGHDTFAPGAISLHEHAGASTLLAGFIENAGELAGRLGLDASAAPARLAAAALTRFGSDTPAEMLGEWSLLDRAADGTLTLMVAAGVRDPIFYAVSGQRVAVAPDLFVLARLDWVDAALDEAGLLFCVAQARLREGRGDTTMLRGVRHIGSGASVVIDPRGGVTRRQAEVLVPQPPLRIGFAELVEEAERVLRRILADRLARGPGAAHKLSGGIDSSLLAWLGSEERPADCRIMAVSSAAPPGSGLPDETAYADIVAEAIRMPCHHVWPDAEANIYRPRTAILAGQNGPPMSNRHPLTDALMARAMTEGATMLIDGGYGEMTATVRLPREDIAGRLRAAAGRLRRRFASVVEEDFTQGPFHVRLAPHRRATLPEVMTEIMARPSPEFAMPRPGALFGYIPGADRGLTMPNEFYPGGLRTEFPFRDMRLLRLFAGVPVSTILEGGPDRAVARSMMAGHLPDSIRLRRQGMPASPDHNRRLQQQALAARERIPLFRKAGLDDWLDLDWLDEALPVMAAHGPQSVVHANTVQMTAIMAEFLLWWNDQGRSTTP